MTHTPEPAFRSLDHISSNAQDTSKLAALSARIAELEAAVHHAEYKMEGWLCKQYPLETCLYPDSKDWVDGSYRDRVEWLHTMYESAKIEIAQLQAMLDAVGAGGVGQSIKPPVQPDTSPAAWAIYSDDGTAIRLWSRDKATAQEAADKFGRPLVPLYTAPQPTENLKCKSTQKRLATLWGYVKKEPDHFRDAAQMVPARQPLTDEKLYALYCEAMKGYYISSLHHWRDAEAHKFARAIEAAVANQPPRQPLTDSQVKELVKKQPAEDLCRWSYGMGIKDAEAAHGITGGQQ